ncbi:MAG: amino acid adenylation domain-containing protein [Anaerolineales bacterium]
MTWKGKPKMRADNIEAIYPLSPTQHGILFHSSYDQKSSAYVESLSFRIRGNLDIPAFQNAWQRVVERHAVLRTLFVWKNRETPLQIVHRQVNLPWQELDWSQLPESDQHSRLDLFLRTDRENGFDLSKAPIHRCTLIRLAPDTYQFVWSYHHIVLDGWSINIVLEEVFAFYRSFREGSALQMDPPRAYKDYINWLRKQDLTAAEAFWKERLQGFAKPTSMFQGEMLTGSDRAKSSYDSEQLRLTKTVSEALQQLARERQLTLSTLFQGAWALLLSRYSGETDVVFGAAVSGRSILMTGIETSVGLFIGSLPVRVKIPRQAQLTSWLQQMQEQQAQARQYEYSSLRDIQSWSELNRSQGKALFDTILSFNNYDFNGFLKGETAGLEISDVSSLEGSHYPLTMLIDPGDEIQVRINYDCGRFDNSMIHRMLGHLQVLLEEMATNPDKSVSAYSILTAVEKQKLLVKYNQTENPAISAEGNIVRLFEQQVSSTPDSIALRFDGQAVTYDQVNQQANQLAHCLKRHGVGPEQVVAFCLDRSPQAIIAILGTLKAGGGYLPMDATLPSKRLEWMLEETAAPVVLTTRLLADRLPASKAQIILLDEDWPAIESESNENLSLIADPEQMAYIIYTSGSTGKPKGTVVRHGNLLNYIVWARNFYLKGQKLDFPLFSSLSFDLTVTSIFVPLVSGGSMVIYGDGETATLEVLDVIRDDLVDIIKLTPAHLGLIQAANLSGKRLRKMIVGGEDFKRSLAQGIHDLFGGRVEIYNEYGPTEATVGCMIHRFDPQMDKDASVPIGKPIDNAQTYILDEHLQPVPTGVIGEMCIGGAGVARGYLQRPELTEAKFVSNPMQPGSVLYRTGDLARWTEKGQMQFLGRSDHQVKIKGFRIELGEIESALLNQSDIEAAVVTVFQPESKSPDNISQRCMQCGLPDNYPGITFDSAGVCNTCRDFSALKDRFQDYFKSQADLQIILDHAKQTKSGKYDCMVLYSGGKDSTYMLSQLVREFGMQPLVFSMDNGYISEEAKENIRRVTESLGVDLVFGQTPHMNAIFTDSLKRHSNVCDGCFKVIYTLSINLARKQGIKYIFTGLSRGQLFETRLSDMFQARIFDVNEIDRTVLAARKAYHRIEDAVSQLMDVKMFESDTIFDEVQLVDFFRYTDVPLHEMYRYLNQNAPWVRPSDTGRSTNCLINDVGIYIHKKERSFHNYALPYSWDVRMGHKTRAETVDELSDDINHTRVYRILSEIGYDENEKVSQRLEKRLVAYYVSREPIPPTELRKHLSTRLPDYMIPTDFIRLDRLPLTVNGKVDRRALPDPDSTRPSLKTGYVPPATPLEMQLARIWSDVLHVQQVGIHDNFFELGGDSISTIHVMMRVSQTFEVNLLPVELFEVPTIAGLSDRIENALIAQIEQLSDKEAEALLSSQESDKGA